MHVVICGGGAIGASIAYFLSCRGGIRATVVERTGLACAASGKAGGFLARHWCDGSPVEELARRSFDLHAELAGRLEGDRGYRRLDTYGGFGGARHRVEGPAHGWLSEHVTVSQQIGTPSDTAQVHPALYTNAMMRAAEAQGGHFRLGRVTGVICEGGRAASVLVDGEPLAADAVVVAMGPWSILAAAWLPLPAVFGLKGHSIVFETGDRVPAEAAFLEYREGGGGRREVLTPELFPRPDGTTYVCGISSEEPLPLDPAEVAPERAAIERLEALCREMSPVLAASPIRARQACYRPVARDGLPLIGKVPGVEGAYIATGHSVWGILNAPATGEAMAELIVDGAAKTVDLAPFDPDRLPPLDPARLGNSRKASV